MLYSDACIPLVSIFFFLEFESVFFYLNPVLCRFLLFIYVLMNVLRAAVSAYLNLAVLSVF